MKINIQIRKRETHNFKQLSLILFIIFILAVFFSLSFIPKAESYPELKKETDSAQLETVLLPPPLIEKKEFIKKGLTLSDILSVYNFAPQDIHKLREDVKPVYDLAKIKAGQEIRFYSSDQEEIQSIEYDIDQEKFLSILIDGDQYTAEIKEFPYEMKVSMIWGTIQDNLVSAVAQQEEQDLLAINLAELFAWDIDFYADMRQNDSFKVLFEKKYLEDEFIGYGNILAAEFTNQGETFQAFRYTYADTEKWDFFDFSGNSLRKEFLKSPIGSARITSRFSYSRLHPIRKVYRPHLGVDYAAPVGTRVQATASGTVTFAGWNGASGRMIKIRHKNNYETMYLHLRSFTRGIKKGAKVEGGQVIGRVGSSGESTGPHLDYRIKYRSRYINPLAWKFKPVEPLREGFLENFQKMAKEYQFWFEAPLILSSHFRRSVYPVWPVWFVASLP